MIHEPLELLLVSVIVAGAAAIKGTIGFGFPLVAVPLLSSILGPRIAVPLIAIPSLVGNVIMVVRGGATRITASLVVVFLGIILGTLAGALLIKALDPQLLSVLVGVITLLYVIATAVRLTVRIPIAARERAAPIVGLLAGLMGGSTGVFAPLLASYLHMLELAKREFVFWVTLMFLVGNIVQVGSYYQLGLYGGSVLEMSLLACLPMVVGTGLGLVLQDRLSPETFSRIVLAIAFLASLNLLAHGLL